MIYDILQYGAVGDGTANDGPAIQKAIDACAAAGGGRVLVPGGHSYKCGSILLHSHVELHLEHGSRLKASENKEDFLEVEAAYRDHYRDTSLKVPSYENCEYDGEPKMAPKKTFTARSIITLLREPITRAFPCC